MHYPITIDMRNIGEFTAATFLARDDMRNIGVLLRHEPSATVLCIDAPNAETILIAAQQLGWSISHLLITHHHWDHVHGITEMKTKTGCTVYGCMHPKIAPVDHIIEAGDVLNIAGIEIHIIPTPGHCQDQIAYHIPAAGIAFVADVIFNLSCGRLLDGTPAQMFDTLQRIKTLPPETLLWFGHDYLEANIRFSLAISPEDSAIDDYIAEFNIMPQTLPCPIMLRQESAANLFLRAGSLEEFTRLRMMRDGF